jgi:archaetidylinositol phosphate synthase
MTLDSYRPHVARFFPPFVALAQKLHLTPNALTILSFFAAGGAGVAFYKGSLGLGVVMVALNAVFDALDGAVARAGSLQSKKGDFLDHAVDRYADIFIITGIFAGGAVSWQIGVFALTGVLMSSYLGTQAQAVGVGRYYGGLLGRADRLVLVILAGILGMIFPGQYFGLTQLGWVLGLFGVLGHYTAFQRFRFVWKQL